MRADDEIRLGILVDQPGTRLQPLPACVLGLVPVGYHPGSAGLEHLRNQPKLIRENFFFEFVVSKKKCCIQNLRKKTAFVKFQKIFPEEECK